MVKILLENGESSKTQPPRFWYLRSADTIGSVTEIVRYLSSTWGLLLPVICSLFLWQPVTFLGSVSPSLILLKVSQWLFLILGCRQKSFQWILRPFLCRIPYLQSHLPSKLNSSPASGSLSPRQHQGSLAGTLCWSIVLVLALCFSQLHCLNLLSWIRYPLPWSQTFVKAAS